MDVQLIEEILEAYLNTMEQSDEKKFTYFDIRSNLMKDERGEGILNRFYCRQISDKCKYIIKLHKNE